MSKRRVDYDRVAPTYNRRFAGESSQSTAAALLSLTRDLGAERVLEVGCGTGRWLADLSALVGQVHGLDLSDGMLRQAQTRTADLLLVRGRAAGLPFPDAAFDLIYCVNAIHHFDRQRAFVDEARRLLRPGGALAVLGFDPRQHRDKWYVYDFFDGTYETDLARFPSWGMVLDWMVAADFSRVEWRLAERIWNPKVGGAVLDDPFLAKNSASQLVLLSDAEYETGIEKIRRAVEAGEAAGNPPTFPCEILMRMLVGRV